MKTQTLIKTLKRKLNVCWPFLSLTLSDSVNIFKTYSWYIFIQIFTFQIWMNFCVWFITIFLINFCSYFFYVDDDKMCLYYFQLARSGISLFLNLIGSNTDSRLMNENKFFLKFASVFHRSFPKFSDFSSHRLRALKFYLPF